MSGIIAPFAFMGAEDIAVPLFLDIYTGAHAAYSVRKLSSSYTGSALRVERSNDNNEQDIGFDVNGNLNTSALTTFVGANTGRVVKFYDQSGNSRDMTAYSDANAPVIVSSGTLLTASGAYAAMRFDGDTTTTMELRYTETSQITSNDHTWLTVVKTKDVAATGTAQYGRILSWRPVPGNDYNTQDGAMMYAGDTLGYGVFKAGNNVNHDSWASVRDLAFLAYSYRNGVNIEVSLNTDTPTTAASWGGLNYDVDIICLGNNGAFNDSCFAGFIQEHIIWGTDESANDVGMRANINDYFSIY